MTAAVDKIASRFSITPDLVRHLIETGDIGCKWAGTRSGKTVLRYRYTVIPIKLAHYFGISEEEAVRLTGGEESEEAV